MSGPGSSDALVLPSLSAETEPPAETGSRITPELEVYLDGTRYSSVAVAHGLSPSASAAFELGKRRRTGEQGVIWVTDPDLLGHLTGDRAPLLKRLLKRKGREVMSFFSVRAERVTGRLHSGQLRTYRVDAAFDAADEA